MKVGERGERRHRCGLNVTICEKKNYFFFFDELSLTGRQSGVASVDPLVSESAPSSREPLDGFKVYRRLHTSRSLKPQVFFARAAGGGENTSGPLLRRCFCYNLSF